MKMNTIWKIKYEVRSEGHWIEEHKTVVGGPDGMKAATAVLKKVRQDPLVTNGYIIGIERGSEIDNL